MAKDGAAAARGSHGCRVGRPARRMQVDPLPALTRLASRRKHCVGPGPADRRDACRRIPGLRARLSPPRCIGSRSRSFCLRVDYWITLHGSPMFPGLTSTTTVPTCVSGSSAWSQPDEPRPRVLQLVRSSLRCLTVAAVPGRSARPRVLPAAPRPTICMRPLYLGLALLHAHRRLWQLGTLLVPVTDSASYHRAGRRHAGGHRPDRITLADRFLGVDHPGDRVRPLRCTRRLVPPARSWSARSPR